jgi:hypothetical protein
LIFVRRGPAVLASRLGELTVSDNPGMLRRELFNIRTSSGNGKVSGSARRKLKIQEEWK